MYLNNMSNVVSELVTTYLKFLRYELSLFPLSIETKNVPVALHIAFDEGNKVLINLNWPKYLSENSS